MHVAEPVNATERSALLSTSNAEAVTAPIDACRLRACWLIQDDGSSFYSMACGACCPCCIGSPTETEWWIRAGRFWFLSFIGLTSLAQLIVFIIEWNHAGGLRTVGGSPLSIEGELPQLLTNGNAVAHYSASIGLIVGGSLL